MSTTPVFSGRIDQGRLVLDEPQKYLVHLSGLNGKKIELILRRARSQRSLQQNRFYWGVVVEILADAFGYTPEEMHEALKFKFLRIHNEKGQDLDSVKSTTKLDTKEFTDYVDTILRWAVTEYGIYIPDPGQVEF